MSRQIGDIPTRTFNPGDVIFHEGDDPKGEAAKRELDEALRSLGLQHDKLQQNAVQKDSMRDLKQGYRGAVPLEYQERLRAYNQGVSRAARDGE